MTWGEIVACPDLRSRLAGCAAPGYDFSLPADGVAAPESVARGDYFVRVRGAGLPTAQPQGMIFLFAG